jgi:hypothetical protein
MKFEPTYVPEDAPRGEPTNLRFYPEHWVPRLTAEEAERGTVFLVEDDGGLTEASTIVDPDTGGVYALPKD